MEKRMKFSASTREHLGHYVYALVDPSDQKIFYVGKANANNRAFDHLRAFPMEHTKSRLIEENREAKLQPQVEVLRYGMSSKKQCF
jgi:hypothetical protein